MLELLDYRRKVSELYSWLRKSDLDETLPPERQWEMYRERREHLFATHSESALDAGQQAAFQGFPYFDYDAKLRFLVDVDKEVDPEIFEVPLQNEGLFKMERFAKVNFVVEKKPITLSLFWVLGYGGGMFLPFRDATNKSGKTYGGGRYLLDTIKHADLGMRDGQMVLDFNYAYNPSCAYNSHWHCPLAPAENWLDVEIAAGELMYPAAKI